MSAKTIPWKQVNRHWEIYLFILPSLVLILLFQYYPAASGIFHSFFRWNGADISEFVGLKNYRDLVKSTAFWTSFKVAFLLGFWNVLKMLPPIAVAVWISRCRSEKLQYLYRLMFVVPMVVPGLVIALIWRTFFFEATQGYLNEFLDRTHLLVLLSRLDVFFGWGGIFVEGVRPAWLGDPRLVLVACVVWGFPWVGSFAVLTHLAKLQNIPKDVYEAADIDGANWWSKFTGIELPLIMSSIYLMLVFVIIGTIKDAGMILALVGLDGGPGGKATVPALFMLRKAFVAQEMGAACAIGIVLTCVVMLLQKASVVLMQSEENASPWGKRILRGLFLLLGLWMVTQAPWRGLGTILLVALFPYGPVFGKPWKALMARLPKRERPLPVTPEIDHTAWNTRLGQFSLRASKHAGIMGVLLFAFLPVYLMMAVSLKDNQQFYDAPASVTAPFHWHNWLFAWKTIAPSVANSIFISTTGTVMTLWFALCGAYFFARVRMPLSGLIWNAFLVLLMMPSVANLVPLFRLLKDMHLLNTLTALILVGTSGGLVLAIFVLRNFVEEIPKDLFEAAEIDGASHFRQMREVVLPLCGPILGTVGVMHFISEWNEFVLPLIVMRDAESLPVMVQLQRLSGEYVKNFGPMMAGYALASIPVILLFMFSMRLFVKGMTEGGVKG
jgi:ABC-type glycerol-3-phosphate transport system permease component